MKICHLDLDVEDPKLAQIVADGLKKIAVDCMKEVAEMSRDYQWYDGKIIPHKDVLKLSEIIQTLEQLTEQIEAAEDGSKLVEGYE